MEKLLTREQNIKKARQMRKFGKLIDQFQYHLLKSQRKPARKEFFIDTAFGRVRTLGYGFETAEKAPIFFDLHGGGFILGSADMDERMNLEFNKQVGCKVISIQYAKAPDFPYPAAVNQGSA